MFDNSFNGNHKQFLKNIRAKHKDHHNISTLVVDGETISGAINKANALNNYFQSVFTKENLTNNGINNHICQWINTSMLNKRSQRVALDGSFSDFVSVHSKIPQGTVLGPLMFLLYINDISQHVNFLIC